jgi:predicted ABC-class ATPase
MKTANELKEILRRIDRKSYPAYKELRGTYQFRGYILSVDHVQGDPFAAPSRVSIHMKGAQAGFPSELYDTKEKRIALQDQLLRFFAKQTARFAFQTKGSGKSGLMAVSRPGQEILERSGCVLDETNGNLILRMEIGFPAQGRTVRSGELEKILFDFLSECVEQALVYRNLNSRLLKAGAQLAEDQTWIREHLEEMGLVAFVADGSILPRESGVSGKPMREAVAFEAPKSMRVEMHVPNRGKLTGMGIRKGITLIVGGGYHGKSTLLKALESGVYNHIAGDGREYVITDATAVKLRAEDGRSIQNVDISMFIRDLPNGKDTVSFETEDASGSTSQAANVVEAMEAGSQVFLIDEDTSATNFMIRDELMQRVVHRDMEPITPFIDRVRELYRAQEISTILVAGSSGSYFHKADCIVQMNRYVPVEITAYAKDAARDFPMSEGEIPAMERPDFARYIQPCKDLKGDRIKLKTSGKDAVIVNRESIDLRYVEQLADNEQLVTLGHLMKYAGKNLFDGKKTVQEIVAELERILEKKGFDGITSGGVPGNLAMPRRQEIFACLNRSRFLRVK